MPSNPQLARRIQYGAMILVALLTMGFYLLLNRHQQEVLLEHVGSEFSERTELSASRIEQATRTLAQDVVFLSRTPPVSGIRRATNHNGVDPENGNRIEVWHQRMQGIFSAFLEAHPDYFRVRYLGVADQGRDLVRVERKAGRTLSARADALRPMADQDYFRAATGAPEQAVHLSQIRLDHEPAQPSDPPRRTLHAATPVYGPDGKAFGLIVLTMDVASLLSAAVERPPYNARAYLTDEQGRYLNHPDPAKTFTSRSGQDHRLDADLPTLADDYRASNTQLRHLRSIQVEGRKAWAMSRKAYFDPAQSERFLLLTYIVPDRELRASQHSGQRETLMISLLSGLTWAGFILLLLRQTFRPLQQLTQATRRIADGNLREPLPDLGAGDIGHLAQTLEQLRRNVAAREADLMHLNAALDQRVQERTAELRLAANVIERTSEGVMVTDAHGVILAVNPAFTRITSFTAAEAIGQTPRLLKSDHQDQDFYRGMWQILQRSGQWEGEIWNRRRDGEAYLERLSINRIPGEGAQPLRYVGVFNDITELRRKDAHIQHLAFHDALTGLPNRTLLKERLGHAILIAERESRRLAVMLMDLDRFKHVNDTLGHHIGDQLLQEVARRMLAQLRATDTVARMGGDEFVILLEQQNEPEHCAVVAQALIDAVSEEMEIGGHRIQVGASIGITFYPDDGDDPLRCADAAMYAAKRSGRGAYCFFQAEKANPAAQ
ncbi:MAG: diguanylate cyclase [Betaproteobacteria bacterium]|nr:diguanylate cyclase [Betaproteobacteria bacterium]